ncbi:hypothetical protein JR316_0001907 [Psilocybe cubensis]|uniref:J domain-containing protein n=2 Tax=Psilocybe cubensis TaxID=181762 RepID=A0A8H8CPS5_PSICU|nr:hypothetical protein JR316_0001907 [Psilocybe cubensis]KAH9485003.1 hypothetical protein JR316_0001907 [Psilocybe cubensis]
MSLKLSVNLSRWTTAIHRCRCPNKDILPIRRHRHAAPEAKHGNPYPYPTHRNPTPHQLFHLPKNASKSDIKARYYDLVRIYHPDKAIDSVPPEVAHTRFQAITAAYDVLRGKIPPDADATYAKASDLEARHRTTAAYRAARQRRQELYSSGAVDDSRKDKIIVAGVVLTIFIVIAHTATTRREALAEAMARSRSMSANAQRTNSQRQRIEEERLSLDAPTNKQEHISPES